MSNPKLYESTSDKLPWSQYVWVNDKTNEVYGNFGH